MGDEYDFRTPKGGIGALSEALAASLKDNGGSVRYNSNVSRILTERGKATGVQLRNGEKINAKAVLSSLDARTTFFGLTGDAGLPSDFINRVKEINYNNVYIQIHLTLKEPPLFTGHLSFANDDEIRWLMACIPSRILPNVISRP